MEKKVIELVIGDEGLDNLGVDAIALVESPAIEENFLYFKEEKFVEPTAGEEEGDFIGRCMSSLEGEFPDQEQRLAVCYSYWQGSEEEFLRENPCLPGYVAYGTKIKGGKEVPNCIPDESSKQEFESYNDYPESAKNAAARALKWRDEHPEQSCGTRVGWARANQLAKGENISEETIARMASFARHLQYKDVPYSEGCGGLMVDAWGGQAGIEWAQNKLESIRNESSQQFEDLNLNVLGYQTENFDICPIAINLFKKIMDRDVQEDEAGMIRAAALQADALFGIEKGVIDKEMATKEDLAIAVILAKDFMDLIAEIGEIYGEFYNTDFMEGHIETILSYVPDETFDIDVTGLPTYVSEITEEEDEILRELQKHSAHSFHLVRDAMSFEFAEANTDGYTQTEVEKLYKDPTNRRARKYRTPVYKYVRKYNRALSTDDHREWCKTKVNKFFFYTDIMAMRPENSDFGHNKAPYNKYMWQGGPNCIHAWRKYEWNYEKNKLSDAGWAKDEAGTANRSLKNRGYMNAKTRRASELRYIIDQQKMSKEGEYHFNEVQRIVTGPAMIPNYEMPRRAEDGSKYYVYFTEETIKDINEKFMREKRLDQTNIEHDSEDIRTNNYVYESWIVEDPNMDKAKAMGFNVPKGTWMVSMRVMDDTTWDLIKEGKIKGFSVEGFFGEMVQK